jgi:predicted DNA-binding transcriptional regulator YafY
MRASRLLSILILLQLRARVTADALADEFEVSKRTIYRDMDELSAAGIPVYADRGPGGGFALLDGYRTKLTGLASDEAEAMLMIGLPGPADAIGLGNAAGRARMKLLAALPAGNDAGRIGARFHFDTTDWYQAADAAPHLPAIARAVLDQQQVAIRYESWKGERDWLIDPLGLVLKGGHWYCAARAGARMMTLRVSNMLSLQVTDAVFERPADFDLPHWWAAQLARFEAELRPITALLRATPEGRKRLAKCGAYAAQAVAGDGFEIHFPIENVEQAALLLLGMGAEVEVMEPLALRHRMRELAGQIGALNAG